MHPDGDELLYLVSGRVDVILEDGGDETTVGVPRVETLQPGEAVLVPRGVWHRVDVREPSRLVHVTPGPGGGHRPLALAPPTRAPDAPGRVPRSAGHAGRTRP